MNPTEGVPAEAGAPSVLVAWGRASASELLAGLLGEPVTVRHACPACGSSEHGRPWLRLGDGRRPVVSIAHARGLTLVGLSWDGRLGVDLEPLDADVPDGVRHPNDPELAPLELWVHKEAYLKATGDGLRRPMATVDLTAPGVTWGSVAIPGFVAAWCRVCV